MCDYCQRDMMLHRIPHRGGGSVYIRYTFDGVVLETNGPRGDHIDMKIHFCPVCGEDLRGVTFDGPTNSRQ